MTLLVLLNREVVIPQIAHILQAPRRSDKASTRSIEPVYDHATQICITGGDLKVAGRQLINAEFVLRTPHLAEKLTKLRSPMASFYPRNDKRPAGWLLKDVVPRRDLLSLTPAGLKVVRGVKDPDDVFVITDLSFDQLSSRSQNVQYASTSELFRRIRNPTFGTASVRSLVLNLHVRLMQPFINLSAVVLAVPLIVRRESFGLIVNLAICSVVPVGLGLAMWIGPWFEGAFFGGDMKRWLSGGEGGAR